MEEIALNLFYIIKYIVSTPAIIIPTIVGLAGIWVFLLYLRFKEKRSEKDEKDIKKN